MGIEEVTAVVLDPAKLPDEQPAPAALLKF